MGYNNRKNKHPYSWKDNEGLIPISDLFLSLTKYVTGKCEIKETKFLLKWRL